MLKTNLELPKENVCVCGGGHINQELGMNIYILLLNIYEITNKDLLLQHRELYSIFCGDLYEKRV